MEKKKVSFDNASAASSATHFFKREKKTGTTYLDFFNEDFYYKKVDLFIPLFIYFHCS